VFPPIARALTRNANIALWTESGSNLCSGYRNAVEQIPFRNSILNPNLAGVKKNIAKNFVFCRLPLRPDFPWLDRLHSGRYCSARAGDPVACARGW
jgi:hypothetical protein